MLDECRKSYRRVPEIFIECFHKEKKNHALTTFQFVSDMRWFRGHAEAPRLLRLSPLRADEDVNGTSYHFHVRSRCRGKISPEMAAHHLVIVERVKYHDGRDAFDSLRLSPERIGPIFAKMSCTALRAARTRAFACRPAVCAWRDLNRDSILNAGITTQRSVKLSCRVTGWKARIEAN